MIAPVAGLFINNLLIRRGFVPIGLVEGGFYARGTALAVVEVADEQLEEVVDGDYAGDAAVFVEDDGEALPEPAHALEEHVGLDGIRDEVGGLHALGHGALGAPGLEGEVVLDVEHADDLVGRVAADGVEGVAGGEYLALPFLGALVGPEDAHLRAVGAEGLGALVVELKEVLDKLVLLLADAALLAAGDRGLKMSAIESHCPILL